MSTDAALIRVPIATKVLHRATARIAATSNAEAQAEARGWLLCGPPLRTEGDLASTHVDIVWSTVVDELARRRSLRPASSPGVGAHHRRALGPAGAPQRRHAIGGATDTL